MADAEHRAIGERGEALAAEFLKRLGYDILQRNCRKQYGELDLVARDGRTVVFVEVKTRASGHWGDPADAVGPRKQRKLCLTALAFTARHRLHDRPLRFDVVAILLADPPDIRHHVNAFTLPRSLR